VPERTLTAEEKAAGSDDPAAQSEAIMDDSARRSADRDAAPGTFVEHRTSEQATPPVPDVEPDPGMDVGDDRDDVSRSDDPPPAPPG